MVILFLFFAETESATFVYVEAQMSLRQTESVLATQWDAALEGSAQCGRPTEPLPLAAQPWRRPLLGPGGGGTPCPCARPLPSHQAPTTWGAGGVGRCRWLLCVINQDEMMLRPSGLCLGRARW